MKNATRDNTETLKDNGTSYVLRTTQGNGPHPHLEKVNLEWKERNESDRIPNIRLNKENGFKFEYLSFAKNLESAAN